MNIKSLVLLLTFFEFAGVSGGPGTKAPAQRGALTVIVSNFRNNKGDASVALYKGGGGFPKSPEKAIKILYTRIENKKAVAVFDDLPSGVYAVSVYHDENSNKKMDTNFFGIPKEGVGASNNARGHFGPPKYSDAKFSFNGNNQTITINIIYL